MLDDYLSSPWRLLQLRSGPSGPFLDGFAAALFSDGRRINAMRYINTAAHVGVWARRHGIAIADVDETVIERFERHLAQCRCVDVAAGWRGGRKRVRKRVRVGALMFLDFLRREGVARQMPSCPIHSSALVAGYCSWLRNQRGVVARTIQSYMGTIRDLIAAVGDDPALYSASALRSFILTWVRLHAPHSPGKATSALRSFLLFLVAQGRCSADLVGAVPRIPGWRLAKLPPYLSVDTVEKLINSCDESTRYGLRDRAILLLFARLGLRNADVAGLRLGDVDWKTGRIRVIGKGRRETWLPLSQDVGDAILAYLERARPPTKIDHVFVTTQAPIRPMLAWGTGERVKAAMKRVSIDAPSHGGHILRHSLASRMLREGATLDSIGAVLRHRHVDTTAIYAKIDIGLLRQIAQPWPMKEVPSC